MHADLERLIALQKLDTASQEARKRLADQPERLQALDGRIEAARQEVASAKDRLSANQTARRELEKGVALHQGRLSKFREQAMAVKTNQEYHAIQHEIAFAQAEIKTIEDQMLESMLEADDLTSQLKHADWMRLTKGSIMSCTFEGWNARFARAGSVRPNISCAERCDGCNRPPVGEGARP